MIHLHDNLHKPIKHFTEVLGFHPQLPTVESPVKGNVMALENVKDEVFSTGAMGKGIAVEPVEGKVYGYRYLQNQCKPYSRIPPSLPSDSFLRQG